ncbi:Eukaryotic translation initiation factor 4E-1 [Penicillium argentinense]|uniref:Eukaryotic translation initiation factor 4E-1 n=1 Tax=Penicillium argentinense TaxID=1131581 RepID=A0A9W9G0B0_9EURO|nr:Eukaryotic translation initiation factor 4E-1 [Penicillium argentinense]KAJ5109623.1 Eukaryotic translation initiation factor 4E-1 [Penicillium argentinense]
MLRWYQSKLARRPILTASVTSAVLFGSGDVLAQQAVDRRGLQKHDFARTGRMALYGGAVFGPVATAWFGILQRHVVLKNNFSTTVARVGCDQFLFAPVQLTCFLSSMAIMEGVSPAEKWIHSFWPAYKANMLVWPWVQGANFAFVPLELRVLVVNVVSLESRADSTKAPTSPPFDSLCAPTAPSRAENLPLRARRLSNLTLPPSPPPLNPTTMAAVAENGHAVTDENAAPAVASSTEEITVFHDPENFNVKHPLMHEWTLWFTKPPSGKGDNWNDLLKEVVTFSSVEEFWGIYNNICPTSELGLKADYHLFKKGVRPEWEDPQNKHGGKWSYQFKDKRSVPIDDLWLHAQLAAIGETLEGDEDNEVMGVVVNVRKGFYRVGLWTRTVGKSIPGDKSTRTPAQGKDVLEAIGRRFKDVLRLKEADVVEFSGHTDSAHSGSTRAKAKYTV